MWKPSPHGWNPFVRMQYQAVEVPPVLPARFFLFWFTDMLFLLDILSRAKKCRPAVALISTHHQSTKWIASEMMKSRRETIFLKFICTQSCAIFCPPKKHQAVVVNVTFQIKKRSCEVRSVVLSLVAFFTR